LSFNRWLERTPGLGADEFNFTEKYKVTLLSISDNSSAFLLCNDDIYKLRFLSVLQATISGILKESMDKIEAETNIAVKKVT
jgi:hypothetical protein